MLLLLCFRLLFFRSQMRNQIFSSHCCVTPHFVHKCDFARVLKIIPVFLGFCSDGFSLAPHTALNIRNTFLPLWLSNAEHRHRIDVSNIFNMLDIRQTIGQWAGFWNHRILISQLYSFLALDVITFDREVETFSTKLNNQAIFSLRYVFASILINSFSEKKMNFYLMKLNTLIPNIQVVRNHSKAYDHVP